MNDREMLEYAARSVGIDLSMAEVRMSYEVIGYSWNPRISKDDAFALASDLGMVVDFYHERAIRGDDYHRGSREWVYAEDDMGSPELSICEAITMCAALIGKAMEDKEAEQ